MAKRYYQPLATKEPTSNLILETKIGKIQYDNLDQILAFLLNNPVDWFAVYRDGKDITNIVQPILDYRK